MRESRPLLEVAVVHERDVAGAHDGGADRLQVGSDEPAGGRTPDPSLVSAVCRETDLPVRVVLRLNDGLSTTGGELTRLVGLAEDYLAMGVEGMVFGFLDTDLEVDVEVCSRLAESLSGVPWTFSRAIDSALSPDRAWRQALRLPGLDAVLSAGSPQGMHVGFDDLITRAETDALVAERLMAGGGLLGEHVPWLVRAGVRQFQLGAQVRQDGSWSKAYVDAALVRSWRMLLDDATDRALGRPAG